MTDAGDRPLISVGAWMRAMEDPDLSEQHHRDPAALALTNLGPKLNEKRLDRTPRDICPDRLRKDGFQGNGIKFRGKLSVYKGVIDVGLPSYLR
jgi:hypothetical protein